MRATVAVRVLVRRVRRVRRARVACRVSRLSASVQPHGRAGSRAAPHTPSVSAADGHCAFIAAAWRRRRPTAGALLFVFGAPATLREPIAWRANGRQR